MKALQVVVFGLLGLMVLFLAVAAALPASVTVERNLLLDLPACAVLQGIDGFSAEGGAPVLGRSDDPSLAYGGPRHGVGSRVDWSGPDGASGSQLILEVAPTSVSQRIVLEGGGEVDSNFQLEGSRPTLLRWTLRADLGGNLPARLFGPALQRWLDRAAGRELEKLGLRLATTHSDCT